MEGQELAVRGIGQGVLSVNEIKARIHTIEECYRGIMKENVHYGTIPGTNKPTLLKPGAEKLLSMFQLAAEPIVDDLSGDGFVKYRVTVRVIHVPSGAFVGTGVGECSSDEEKYRWRYSICDGEWEETPDHLRREKWRKGRGNQKPKKVRQIKTSEADVGNTIVKMAKKRALVDAALTITGASDMFDQDLDDLPEHFRQVDGTADAPATPTRRSERPAQGTTAPATAAPAQVAAPIPAQEQPPIETPAQDIPPRERTEPARRWPEGGRVITEPQHRRLMAIGIREAGMTAKEITEYVQDQHGFASTTDITMGEAYETIINEIRN